MAVFSHELRRVRWRAAFHPHSVLSRMDRIRQSDHAPQPSPFQTSLIGYSDSITIHGGTFTQHNSSPVAQTAFEELTKAVARGAFHNSADRFDPPKCHPRTRLAITERIMNWILGKESTNDLIMWLHGPAGSGKSAIAQRIAELCHDANLLLASFFCSRSDPRRNCAKHIVPTIAYQIARAFPAARSLIEQEIARDPLIFDQSLETQMVKLIVNPLQPLIDSDFFADPNSPRLVILDGIDEVVDRQEQTRILEAISNILRRNHVPLIFLIASRPEQEISYTFGTQSLAGLTSRLLDDTFHPDKDICIFLVDSFSEIKASHPLKHSIPTSWPSSNSVDELVRKSSGQFIYASTVIRFVKSIRHRPVHRLDIVLGLRPVHRDLPFAELDALYMHILSSLEYPDMTLQIIGAILSTNEHLFNYPATVFSASCIEQLLGLEQGDVDLCLADMTSLVSWDRRGTEPVRILHASFGDFLFDPSRSGAFTIDKKTLHAEMTCHCLRHLIFASNSNLTQEYWQNQFSDYAIYTLMTHLSRSTPTPQLMDLLHNLSYGKFIQSLQMYLSTLSQQSTESRTSEIHYLFSTCAWENVFNFVTATKGLSLERSAYYDLRHRLFDQVVKQGFESCHSYNSPLNFLLALRIRCDPLTATYDSYTCYRWNAAACQLTDWDCGPLQEMLFSRAVLPPHSWVTTYVPQSCHSTTLREFLQDASRAEGYVVDAKTYSSASLSCLKYLTRSRLGVPIDIHHTQYNLTDRRNCPWLWNQRMKLISRLPIFKKFNYNGFPRKRCYAAEYSSHFWFKYLPLRKQGEQRQMYLDATQLALVFLRRALPRSAKSDELIAFINTEKPFSQRALQFPAKLKKAKAAMATYLARVQQESGSQSSNGSE